MPYDPEQREAEARKLDALTAISTAIVALGKALTTMIEQNVDQNKKLDAMDRKLDKLLEFAGGSGKQ